MSGVYGIYCRNKESIIYIGSTKDYRNRISTHKYRAFNENYKYYNKELYIYIRDSGWDNIEFKLLKECENNLKIEEQKIILQYCNLFNNNKAYISKEEYKEYVKEYYKKNKDKIREYQKKKKEKIKKN